METNKKQYGFLKASILIFFAIFGIILRSIFIVNMSDFPLLINNALILNNVSTSSHIFTMESIYTRIFSFFFSFIGNKVELAIYFQIVLQVFAIIGLYFSLKKITNTVCAWICYLVFICTPFVFSISINQLFFLIFSLLFVLSAIYIHIVEKEERTLFVKSISSIAIAIIFTQLIFLDSIYLVFVIFGLFLALFFSNSSKEKLVHTKVITLINYIVGILLSIGFYFAINIYFKKSTIFLVFQEIKTNLISFNYQYLSFFKDFKISMQQDELFIYIIIVVFILFLIFGFIKTPRKSVIVIDVLFFSLCLFTIFFQTIINPFMVIIVLAWIIFVLGIQGILHLFTSKTLAVESPIEEDTIKISIESEDMAKDSLIETSNGEVSNTILNDSDNEREIIKTVKFIDNPLPVPKKHVQKVLDYRFEPKEEDMHYDIDN